MVNILRHKTRLAILNVECSAYNTMYSNILCYSIFDAKKVIFNQNANICTNFHYLMVWKEEKVLSTKRVQTEFYKLENHLFNEKP